MTSVLPLYIVVDQSASMHQRVGVMNDGLTDFIGFVQSEPLIADQVRLAIVGFDDAVDSYLELSDLSSIAEVPQLVPRGATAYGPVLRYLAASISADLEGLRLAGIRPHRPVVFFFTDGLPLDPDWESARSALDRAVHPNFIAFGTGDVDPAVLRSLASSDEYAIHLDDGHSLLDPVRSFLRTLAVSTVATTVGPYQGDVDPFVLMIDDETDVEW